MNNPNLEAFCKELMHKFLMDASQEVIAELFASLPDDVKVKVVLAMPAPDVPAELI